ncbi:uroporphyrinogen-III synthase [Paenibacillus sp. TRM 82003]|uniref:uroporphyrinogen-III synthase n=1 Tax=Kineococcus sp. TRM81007 TaxID=2925831 RepID=UPI001F5A2B29|nr:uroporphyrinogen-III synthase [Kineococcus sp. TRM81007]MCI2239374.1 uroporphyrinogen-III synthase [Kineococcus sp. TRM81007]MCI3925056.1 uroporphyrinogen-III synthase [Paenibacillus sp. TRM 82003]
MLAADDASPTTPTGPPAPRTAPGEQLLGVTIGITSDRRSEDMVATFTRKGARVVHAPTMRIVPLAEDEQLVADTRDVVADPPDDVLVTTGIGLRGWVEAADAAGLADDLLATLGRARILARGPKATGAVRANGLREAWSAASEQTAEAVQHMVDEGVAGRSVVVQLHGAADEHQLEPLVAAGARVRGVAVYRWLPPADPDAVQRLVELVCAGRLDAVTFTSAPGAVALLDAAERAGRREDAVRAFGSGVVACAVGDVTAEPLRAAGVEPLVPERWRLGALLRTLTEHLAANPLDRVPTAHGELVLRAQAAVLDGRVLDLAPGPLAVLRRLARARGAVVTREELLAELPGAQDAHAVEVTVARLRAGLPSGELVRTLVKRGYRLDVLETS